MGSVVWILATCIFCNCSMIAPPLDLLDSLSSWDISSANYTKDCIRTIVNRRIVYEQLVTVKCVCLCQCGA
jgi:hypothetical protein